jgi:uncharacterized membrane protein
MAVQLLPLAALLVLCWLAVQLLAATRSRARLPLQQQHCRQQRQRWAQRLAQQQQRPSHQQPMHLFFALVLAPVLPLLLP